MRDAITNPVFLAEPLRLYVVAVRAGWREEASLAARGTLVLGLYDDVHTELLRRLPTLDLMVLLGLHRRRRDLLDQMLSGQWEDAEGQSFGLGKKVVGGTCAACAYVTDNHVWREYRARIFLEMDRRPLGDTVLGSAVDDWSEAQACWRAKCAREGCDKLLWDRDTIMPQLKACIDRLPDAI
ncbi:hypothetical protein R3P38DRAFT_2950999 [Favolaschia claudopus]|uniref:Uncharacterized protein n=1 Tax=Favolaschia claudopus TaxID=2862362 RepID=A0AAW0BE52_9AGAR